MRLFFPVTDNLILFILLAAWVVWIFYDRRDLLSWRNLDLLMLFAWVPLGYYEYGDLEVTTFTGYLPLLYLLPRLLLLAKSKSQPSLVPILSERVLRNGIYFFTAFGILLTFVNPYPLWEIGENSLPVSWCSSRVAAGQSSLWFAQTKFAISPWSAVP